MPDWKSLLGGLIKPKKWIPDRCPVCNSPLKEYNQGRLFECKHGHKFGRDAERVDLINEGDFHGDL